MQVVPVVNVAIITVFRYFILRTLQRLIGISDSGFARDPLAVSSRMGPRSLVNPKQWVCGRSLESLSCLSFNFDFAES